jgi:prepilin-type N-terminal cleavage/methylation domain-containing protein
MFKYFLNKKNNQSGFTLIELLTVVAIIAILSSVVLASITDSRRKARNTNKVNLVKQYINVLELYYNDNGTLPDYGSEDESFCLGADNLDDKCFLFDLTTSTPENPALNTALSQYISGPPASKENVLIGANANMRGIRYSCQDGAETGQCRSYILEWFMEGEDARCGGGIEVFNWSGNSQCMYSMGLSNL